MRGHIYKLSIGDDFYIGSTKSYYVTSRWGSHKNDCNDPSRKQHNYPVYKFIRANGGWDKVKRECLWTGDVESKEALKMLEDDYYFDLKPTLNVTRPYESNEARLARKRETERLRWVNHKEELKKKRGVGISIECECGGSYVKSNYRKHLTTGKHKHFVETGEKVKHRVHDNLVDKNKNVKDCECGGRYSYYRKNEHLITGKHKHFVETGEKVHNVRKKKV